MLLGALPVRLTNDERGEEEKKVAEKRNDTQDDGSHQTVRFIDKNSQNGNQNRLPDPDAGRGARCMMSDN